MRTWRNLAAPNDETAWHDVDGVWPTRRGTYETSHVLTGTDYAASSANGVQYAFAAATLTGRREYVVDGARIWEWGGSSFTNRTGAITVGTHPMMAQYGNVTICVNGAAQATVSSTGGNFAAIADAPNGEIVVVQSNAVLILNTDADADGWHASDVGDYTNWTTGESASGRLIATPGPILAAVPFGDGVLAFKSDAIYRIRYVGGQVKWASELLYYGVGCAYLGQPANTRAKYHIAPGGSIVLFASYYDFATTQPTSYLYAFDGVSPPQRVNIETTVLEGPITYNPQEDVFAVVARDFLSGDNINVYFYCPTSNAWGKCTIDVDASSTAPVMGSIGGKTSGGSAHERSNLPVIYAQINANNIKRFEHADPPGDGVGSCYLQTSMVGRPDRKTVFNRVIPLLRRRRDLGTDSASMEMTLFRELHDTAAQTTRTISEASNRKRFDLLGGVAADNFARFKVTFTALDVEVDDFLVESKDAGRE